MPELIWKGKEQVVNHHLEVPVKTLDRQYTFNGAVKPLEILKYPDQPRQSSNSGDFIKLCQSGAFEILRHEKIYMAQL
jgi:hypothetical protein